MSTSSPSQPIPDPAAEPGTKGADGGASVTGAAPGRRDLDDDAVNGSRNLVQPVAPDPYRDRDPSTHDSV